MNNIIVIVKTYTSTGYLVVITSIIHEVGTYIRFVKPALQLNFANFANTCAVGNKGI